jgi:hypothetical protein
MKGAESSGHARCRICRVVSGGVAWQVVAVYESSRKVEAMPARRIFDKLLGAPPATVLTQAPVLVVAVLDLIASLPLTTSRRVVGAQPMA